MKFHSSKFAIAASLTSAIVWVVCSLLVLLMPEMMMMASGDMVHLNTQSVMWVLTLTGFLKGLVLWSLSVGASAWIFAKIYNRLNS